MPDEAWVDEMVSAWNALDGEKVGTFFAPDAVWKDEALDMSWEGRDAITNVWSTLAPAAFSDWHVQVTGAVCSDEGVAFEWRMGGTHSDSGTTFDTPGVSVAHLRDGLIVRLNEYYDAASFRGD